ncbi:MAG: hypothetical protein PUE18_09405 [Firmicutes bacterium]|nr:hypothetical protein [Bacillota bacterium]
MSTVNGTNLKKMTYNGQKVKKWIHNGVKVWSGATVVYYYHGSTHLGTKEVDEGEDVLRPSGISTAISGYTMIGWATSNSESSIVTSLKASGEAMTLYAIYLPNSYTAVSASHSLGLGSSISKQDTKYISGSLFCSSGLNDGYVSPGTTSASASWTINLNRYRSVTITAQTYESSYGSHSYSLTWDGSAVTQDSNAVTTRTYSSNGTHTFVSTATMYNGYCAIGLGITSAVFSNPKPWV